MHSGKSDYYPLQSRPYYASVLQTGMATVIGKFAGRAITQVPCLLASCNAHLITSIAFKLYVERGYNCGQRRSGVRSNGSHA